MAAQAGDVDESMLQEWAERLYAGAPEDFVSARTAAVKGLRQGGDRGTAAAVAGLRRPTQAAWMVNRLVRERTEAVEELLELGSAMREAQSSLDATSLRELGRQRRRLVAGVAREATALAREAGATVGTATERQVEDTLQAAVVDADLAEVVRSGLLVQALSSTGVDSLADVQAIPGAPRLTVVQGGLGAATTRRKAGRGGKTGKATAEDQAARTRAEREERAAQEREREQARERTRLQRDRRAERRELDKAEASVVRLTRDAEDLRERLAAAESTLREAEERRDSVRARIASIEEALEELSGNGSEG